MSNQRRWSQSPGGQLLCRECRIRGDGGSRQVVSYCVENVESEAMESVARWSVIGTVESF